jgi:hypothetical protein
MSLLNAVFAEIVAFRTHTNSHIKYWFRALFLTQKEFTLLKSVVKTIKIQMPIFTFYLIATKYTKRALLKV